MLWEEKSLQNFCKIWIGIDIDVSIDGLLALFCVLFIYLFIFEFVFVGFYDFIMIDQEKQGHDDDALLARVTYHCNVSCCWKDCNYILRKLLI